MKIRSKQLTLSNWWKHKQINASGSSCMPHQCDWAWRTKDKFKLKSARKFVTREIRKNGNLPTSPPNAAILSLTHCKAAIWSSKPKLLAVLPFVLGLRKPKIQCKIKWSSWNMLKTLPVIARYRDRCYLRVFLCYYFIYIGSEQTLAQLSKIDILNIGIFHSLANLLKWRQLNRTTFRLIEVNFYFCWEECESF